MRLTAAEQVAWNNGRAYGFKEGLASNQHPGADAAEARTIGVIIGLLLAFGFGAFIGSSYRARTLRAEHARELAYWQPRARSAENERERLLEEVARLRSDLNELREAASAHARARPVGAEWVPFLRELRVLLHPDRMPTLVEAQRRAAEALQVINVRLDRGG
jgi:hypothetical protein